MYTQLFRFRVRTSNCFIAVLFCKGTKFDSFATNRSGLSIIFQKAAEYLYTAAEYAATAPRKTESRCGDNWNYSRLEGFHSCRDLGLAVIGC